MKVVTVGYCRKGEKEYRYISEMEMELQSRAQQHSFKFINAYKSAGSRLIKKEYPLIREKLWKEFFWSRSYCLISTGGAPIEVIKQYIQSQGEK